MLQNWSLEQDINLSKKGLLTHFLVQKSCSNIQSDFECFCNLFAINMSNTSRKKYCLKPDKLYTANGCGSMGIFKTLLKSGLREARVHNCTIHTRYHSRFFVQVGHETTCASSGKKTFFHYIMSSSDLPK